MSSQISLISMDLAHFDAVAFARPARRPMVVVRLPTTEYRGCKEVVKCLGPTADGKVAHMGAPPNVRAYIAFSTTQQLLSVPTRKEALRAGRVLLSYGNVNFFKNRKNSAFLVALGEHVVVSWCEV
jgi:hypothetical protein